MNKALYNGFIDELEKSGGLAEKLAFKFKLPKVPKAPAAPKMPKVKTPKPPKAMTTPSAQKPALSAQGVKP